MHPWDRLHREVPGQRVGATRELEGQLWARDRELAPARTVPGESTTLKETKVRNNSVTAKPVPNAPLLMRLVRHPFALDTARGKRAATREPVPWTDLARERLPTISSLTVRERPASIDPFERYKPEDRLRPSSKVSLLGAAGGDR